MDKKIDRPSRIFGPFAIRLFALLLSLLLQSGAALSFPIADYAVPTTSLLSLAPTPGASSVLFTNGMHIGIAHARGMYSPASYSQLQDGAAMVENLGTQSIFLYLTSTPSKDYPGTRFDTALGSLSDLARSAPYAEVLKMPFKTFVLTTITFANPDPAAAGIFNASAEEEEIYQLTKHLISAYHGTGKRFILKNWEGDWYWNRGTSLPIHISPANIAMAIRYYTARQIGVNRARQEANDSTVTVEHALEVNRITDARTGCAALLNKVVPSVQTDWISYSSWESLGGPIAALPSVIHENLSYLRAASGNRPLLISEFGFLDSATEGISESYAKAAINAFENERVSYAFFWQILDNECSGIYQSPSSCAGFGLIKPDGSRGQAWWTIHDLLGAKNDAQIVAISSPPPVNAGNRLNFRVTVKNTGNVPWNLANAYEVRINDRNSEAKWQSQGAPITSPLTRVMPGDAYEFNLALTAPLNSGSHTLNLQMLQEGVNWFGEMKSLTINVQPNPPH